MLSELSDLQESSEEVYGAVEVSFTIDTRSEDGDELIHREYTFSHADEWNKWSFQEFEERRTENVDDITSRNWRRVRHVLWSDSEAVDVDVPPEVSSKLEELLDLEELVIQSP